MNETYPCWYPVQIRFRDLDPLAHVNNTVYFIYFEEARSHYFDQLKPWLKEWPSGEEHQMLEDEVFQTQPLTENPRINTGSRDTHYGILVKETTCTYALPLVRFDNAEVGVRVAKIGRTSFVMEHQIRDCNDHERVFATGRTVLVWCDYRTGRPYPLPQSLRKAFQQKEVRIL